MTDLFELASRARISVTWDRALGRRHGEYRDGVITLNPDRPGDVQRIVLAHELGHAALRHQPTTDKKATARQEREADLFAALLLVDPDEYERAERIYGPSAGAVAAELELPKRFVERMREHVERQRLSGRVA